MRDSSILILKGHEVKSLLAGQERAILDVVRRAYQAHASGDSSLPHSTFVRFPDDPKNRIIALPAYLGEDFKVAGVKWIASFPANLSVGMDRASAVLILNSTQTGRPVAILESSLISAMRTAASAAVAAQYLTEDTPADCLGVVGCGLISFEIVRFVLVACPQVKSLVVFDIDGARARKFAEACRSRFGNIETRVVQEITETLSACSLVSFATTAIEPHISDLSVCPPRSTILHISLRDLAPEVVLAADNVVDDVDHVCRAQTSLHLAEQLVGHRDFIRCTLADIINKTAPARKDDESIAIFSPFGLGVLDLAVGQLAYQMGQQQNLGTTIESFLPDYWND